MTDAERLLALIGRSSEDPLVADALRDLGFPTTVPRPKKGEDTSSLEAKERGLSLNFRLVEHLKDGARLALPRGTLVLSAVFFYAEGVQGYPAFGGDLPRGLRLSDTREQVHQKLGPPVSTSRVLPIDRWEYDGQHLSVDFPKGEPQTVQLVSCFIR